MAKLDPAARAFLARQGFNVETALSEALRNGNLVATLTRERRAGAWAPSATPTTPAGPEMEAPLAPHQVPYEVIENQATTLLNRDRIATKLVADANVLRSEYQNLMGDPSNGIAGSVPKLVGEIREIQAKLSLEEVQADSLRSTDLSMKLIAKQGELLRAENRAAKIERDYADIKAGYNQRFAEAKDHISRTLEAEYNEYATRVEYDAEYTRAADEIVTRWPGAIAAAMRDHKIPESLGPSFRAFAKVHAQAFPEDIADIGLFVHNLGKAYAEQTVAAHRAMSGVYGAAATARAEAVGGVPPTALPPGAPAAPAPQPSSPSDPLAAVYRKAEQSWAGYASAGQPR